ncbi:MAG: MBL fold metallo-hydrolase [Bacillales bacterium]|nr:MBL fold metallo-hydrolase [Bacillales bacterium]
MVVKKFVCKERFSCNVYICSSSKGNFIVDLGYFDNKINDYIKLIGKIDFVLLTHGHYDHISGVNEFHALYPNVPIFAFKDEFDIFTNPKKSCSVYYHNYVPTFDLIPLQEGKTKLNNYEFEVIFTPGHTHGSVLYYFKEENVIFFGDTIIGNSLGRTDLPSGSEVKQRLSLEKIKSMEFPSDMECYFGHGEQLSFAKLKKVNIYLH